jgi:CPA2 family monovalent cation:H+ antiporter-2
LFARARDEHHARVLQEAGANLVTPEALETGLQLSAFVLQTLGLDAEQIAIAIRNERDARISSISGVTKK